MIAWIFKPLGFGTWQATVASFTGLIAKEEVVPYLQQHRPQVLLTVGAGDIDRLVKPISESL